MDRTLDHLSVEMIGDVLRDWLRIQEQAEHLYQDLPPEWRRHVELTGSDYSGFASTFASHLHPGERAVTRAVLRDAIAGLDSLSQPERMIVPVGDDTEALQRRAVELEAKVDRLERLVHELTNLVEADPATPAR